MLPNTHPTEGDRGDRPETALKWFATDDYSLEHIPDGEMNLGFKRLESALSTAQDYSAQGATVYVWPAGQHPGEREAYAVAIGGEIYCKETTRPTDSPTNALRSAMPWVFTDDGETTMEPGLTKREHFTLELAKAMVNAVYPISHNGPNQFIDMRWPLIRDGAIRMSADLLAALGGETLEGDPPIELKSGQPDT